MANIIQVSTMQFVNLDQVMYFRIDEEDGESLLFFSNGDKMLLDGAETLELLKHVHRMNPVENQETTTK
jgi:hypothetical protein